MTGLLSLLPLLEGWDYHNYPVPITSVTSTIKFLKRIEKRGWIMNLAVLTTDAYATLRLRFRGAGGLWQIANIVAEPAFTLGGIQQDPSGWVSLYNRPAPPSTAGIYSIIAFTGGYQGSPLSYFEEIIVEGFLGASSSQSSATISASASVIELLDEPAFKRSLREFLGFGDLSEIMRGLK